MVRWCGIAGLLLSVMPSVVIGAVIESSGTFVPGAVQASVGTFASQAALGTGLVSGGQLSTGGSYSGQSGPLAAVQNAPVVTDDRFNFLGLPGDSLEISYDDIAGLAGIVELDGETLTYFIEVAVGELRVGGSVTAAVILEGGGSFTWELPGDATIEEMIMSITAFDALAIASADSPIGVEDANAVSFTVKLGDTVVDESNSSDLGDAEVAVGSVSAEYVICYDATSGSGAVAVGLRRLGLEDTLDSPRLGLVPLRDPPPRTGRTSISSIGLEGAAAGDFEISGLNFPLVMEPGETAAFTITFRPQSPGDRLASVSLGRPGRPGGFYSFGVEGRGNRPPTGGDDEVIRTLGLAPLKIRLADLLANDIDIDGDVVEFGGFVTDVSMNGRTLSLIDDEWMVYYPGVADETPDDSFVYRVSDGRGATAPSVVRILDRRSDDVTGAIEATVQLGPGPAVAIRVRGIPGRRYQAQFTNALTPPNTVWMPLGPPALASPLNGGFAITDPQPPPGQRIYRIVEALGQP